MRSVHLQNMIKAITIFCDRIVVVWQLLVVAIVIVPMVVLVCLSAIPLIPFLLLKHYLRLQAERQAGIDRIILAHIAAMQTQQDLAQQIFPLERTSTTERLN